MEDVYLARKRNVNGGVFGFVRYSKVKDVEKLLKAINNVWFGDWKVVAKVASFDRFGKEQGVGGMRAEGENIQEGEKSKLEGVKNHEGAKNIMGVTVVETVGATGKENQIIENVLMKDGNVTGNSK
jgi:hypothetical protein